MTSYEFADGPVTATFEHPDAVEPEVAVAYITDALVSFGADVVQDFTPQEQMKKGDAGYIEADVRLDLPGIGRVWISVECPTDEAFE